MNTKDQIQARYLSGEINRDTYEKLMDRWKEFNSPSANEERMREQLRKRGKEAALRKARNTSSAGVGGLSPFEYKMSASPAFR